MDYTLFTVKITDLLAQYNPLLNPWCQHCCCPSDKQPCRNSKAPFTVEEIRAAEEAEDFEPVRNELWGYGGTYNTHGIRNEDLCNRPRHVRRFAYLLVNPDGLVPIQMKADRLHINDGGHRLVAAVVRGDETMQATLGDSGYFHGHEFVKRNL